MLYSYVNFMYQRSTIFIKSDTMLNQTVHASIRERINMRIVSENTIKWYLCWRSQIVMAKYLRSFGHKPHLQIDLDKIYFELSYRWKCF